MFKYFKTFESWHDTIESLIQSELDEIRKHYDFLFQNDPEFLARFELDNVDQFNSGQSHFYLQFEFSDHTQDQEINWQLTFTIWYTPEIETKIEEVDYVLKMYSGPNRDLAATKQSKITLETIQKPSWLIDTIQKIYEYVYRDVTDLENYQKQIDIKDRFADDIY